MNESPQTLESVTEASLQEISGASVTQTASATSLVFTRPLAPTADGKLELSAEEGEEATFIWGSGSDNDLAFHANWGSVTVGDLFCATGTDDDDATDVATANSCESSDPAFDFEVAPADDLALFWRVSEDGAEVAVQVHGRSITKKYMCCCVTCFVADDTSTSIDFGCVSEWSFDP